MGHLYHGYVKLPEGKIIEISKNTGFHVLNHPIISHPFVKPRFQAAFGKTDLDLVAGLCLGKVTIWIHRVCIFIYVYIYMYIYIYIYM